MADEIANKLYAKCCEKFSSSQLLYQRDILSLGVIPNKDLETLLECTQILVDRDLFRVYQDSDNRLAWKVIDQKDAEKIQGLSDNERLVYKVIHETQRNGIWIRQLSKRTDLHKTSLDKALKALEGKNFIKSIHNVKHPGKKVYMLYELQPAEDVSGGAWFTDGVLDTEFIGVLTEFIEAWVSKRSWHEIVTTTTTTDTTAKEASGAANKRQKLNNGQVVKTEVGATAAEKKKKTKHYIPYPASYKYYPTVGEITKEVTESGVTPVQIDEERFQQLLEMMCYDGRLISLNMGQNYKAVRRPDEVIKSRVDADRMPEVQQKVTFNGKNGMIEAPCGQCPVFKLCQPGGAVNPENCEYFDEWFKKVFDF